MKKILKYDRDERAFWANELLFKIDYKLASKYEATIFPLNLNKWTGVSKKTASTSHGNSGLVLS